MKRILHGLAVLGLLVIGPSCSTAIPGDGTSWGPFGFSGFDQGGFSDTDNDGLPDTRLPEFGRRAIAKLDDITNGNDDNLSRGLDNTPSSGFFSDDGIDGDVRGRSENFFDDLAPASKPTDPTAPDPGKTDRKMIYSASYSVMVPTVEEAVQTLMSRVQTLGGYLSKRKNSTLTVRVPADKFQIFVAEVSEYGRVVAESMNGNDVTAQHTDLTIRLENAEQSRKRLLALFEKATKMEDVLKIEEALRRITGEIERMKGLIKLLDNQIAFSSVTVSFQANAPKAKATKRRQQSRFAWINRIGIEQDLKRF